MTNSAKQELEYPDYVTKLRKHAPDLANELAGFASLEAVLNWMQQRGLPPGSVDLVGQDEFSYDFLIRLEPEGRWLVFGVN
jgi:hypothetical protein